jgi:hypothetical protein
MWRWLVVAVSACLIAAPAAAQPPVTLREPGIHVGFLPRITMMTSVEAIGEPGPVFDWDADIGMSVDVVDFGRGRVNVGFNYEAVLGHELQPFDPRQGNYNIDLLSTLRYRGTEIGLLFHHVSRHLGDRTKKFGIAWNDLGAVASRTARQGPWLWQTRGMALATVARSFVDYRADLGGDVAVRRTLTARLSVIGAAGMHARLVGSSRRARPTQTGTRIEGGVRIEGGAAALEFVGGFERRVDADAFELTPRQWAFAGARILSR